VEELNMRQEWSATMKDVTVLNKPQRKQVTKLNLKIQKGTDPAKLCEFREYPKRLSFRENIRKL
jgi:hypothetical protein